MFSKRAAEFINAKISFADLLSTGEVLTGTPTVAEIRTSDLNISNIVINAGAAIEIDGRTVAIGHGVTFRVAEGVSGRMYNIAVTAATDSTPPQTFAGTVELQVNARPTSEIFDLLAINLAGDLLLANDFGDVIRVT